MSLMIVYNACGLNGVDNSHFYIKNIKSILNQNFKDKKIIFSGNNIPPSIFKKVYSEFRNNINYCLTMKKLAVNQTFNHSILKGVEAYGEFDGYMYVASDVSFSDDADSLKKLHDRVLDPTAGIVSPEIDRDNGYFWWFDFEQQQNLWDVFDRRSDLTVPLGKTANLHCKVFSNKIFKKYGRVLPDIFVSYCTESIFSFLCAAVKQRFIIANNVLCHHGENKGTHSGLDGQTLAFGASWDRLYPGSPRTIAEIIADPQAAACGLGYEEWAPPFIARGEVPRSKPHLVHDPEQFDIDGFSMDDRLKNYIKNNFFLKKNVLDYDKITYNFL